MMIKNTVLILLAVFQTVSLIAQDTYKFRDASLSIEERVEDLISQLTLSEKASMLMFESPAIPRLGIRNYSWWNECLHGVARNGKATVFPQAIGMGATFDPDLMKRIGEAIALEARAKYNANKIDNYMDRYAGLTFWSPNVNLFRDPRWGRGQETYGEDPHLISRMGVEFVKGLQGESGPMKVAAMAKHYAVHSGPEKLRHEFNAEVSQYDLWNTYLPAFQALVEEANVEGVMGAYNRTNGEACCAHSYLMQEVLRKKWNFQGYFVSDCWALQDFFQGHNIVKGRKEAAAFALEKGCNLNCGATYPEVENAIASGLITEEDVDRNLRELFPTLFRLGIMDEEGSGPYDDIGLEVVRSQEHLDLTYEAASKSIVMLKNEDKLLPLPSSTRKVFITGPMAAHMQALLGNYYGLSGDMSTILEGIVSNLPANAPVRYVQGALMDRPNVNPMDWYSEEAQIADVTIACMGISQLIEGEEGEAIASPSAGDRDYINLPPSQIEFLKLIRSKAKKLIVVMTGGSAISSPEVHEMADAILYAWYPGEKGGQAIGDIIFGKVSPSGKLPVSFVKTMDDLPPYEDYDMTNRTYRYMQKEALYPFGFGLSYADLTLSDLDMSSSEIAVGQETTLSLMIDNASLMDVEEVIQVYVKRPGGNVQGENFVLRKFHRVDAAANGTTKVNISLKASDFAEMSEEGDMLLPKGEYEIMVGTTSPFQRSLDLGAPQWLNGKITIK
ncbi:MAG: glycoside hydrolase family 3 N-terminal domain-containing protein [Bacteroidota bacterium]